MAFSYIFLLLLLCTPILSQVEGPSTDTVAQPQEATVDPAMKDLPYDKPDEYYEQFQALITEFDRNMQNMNPDDIITFTVRQGYEEVLMEDINNISEDHPSVLRGLFFIVTAEENDIKFRVLNPNMQVIYEVNNRLQGAFSINATINGTYYFVFNNYKSFYQVQITFIFHHFNDLKEIATSKDVNKFEVDIKQALSTLQEVEVHEIAAELRQEIYLTNIQLRKKRIYIFTVLETLAIIATTIVQIYLIKKLLDNKIFV